MSVERGSAEQFSGAGFGGRDGADRRGGAFRLALCNGLRDRDGVREREPLGEAALREREPLFKSNPPGEGHVGGSE